MGNDTEERALPQEGRAFFAQIDALWAVKDYPPIRNCVRLIGVEPHSFSRELFNSEDGCRTFIVDLDWRDAFGLWHWYPLRWGWGPCSSDPDAVDLDNIWLRIEYEPSDQIENSYAYPAFEGADPTYIRPTRIEVVEGGPSVRPIAHAAKPPSSYATDERTLFQLTAFHVGQGMCSVLHGSFSGYILDAGAGTPVSRKDYLAFAHDDGTPFVNELWPLVDRLESVAAILSHPDADHWRLLDWDVGLLAKVQNVFLPVGRPALAFSAPKIKPKVEGIADHRFALNSRNWLDIHRSHPSLSDKNGECLVTIAYCEGRKGMLPGDYVYERMGRDANSAIAHAARESYDVVVVPHHGDEASASSVARPRHPLRSKAFFSAGTHAGYGHPTPASILSHLKQGYITIDEHERRDIVGKRLLP